MKVVHWKYWVAGAVFLSPVVLMLGVFAVAWWTNAHPFVGEHVPSVSWLPKEAGDVSFYKSYSWTAYEFDIGEAAYRRWAGGRAPVPIDKPQRILRYLSRARDNGDVEAVVPKGYYFLRQWSNGGQWHIVYDSERHRAYYHYSPR